MDVQTYSSMMIYKDIVICFITVYNVFGTETIVYSKRINPFYWHVSQWLWNLALFPPGRNMRNRMREEQTYLHIGQFLFHTENNLSPK